MSSFSRAFASTMKCCSPNSISVSSSGTRCFNHSAMGIRSRFFSRLPSNKSRRRGELGKTTSLYVCASAITTSAPSSSARPRIRCRHSRGTSHFGSGPANMKANEGWRCRWKRSGQRSACEIPNPKPQAPKKHQIPSSKDGWHSAFDYRSLGLVWDLGFGIWGFSSMIDITQSLEELDWIPRPKLLGLRRLAIETVEDLLTHYPRRHEDRHQFPRFPREESDVPICLCGEVVKTSIRRFGGWKKIFEATLQEPNADALSQPIVCRWFNLHYIQKMIATGRRVVG